MNELLKLLRRLEKAGVATADEKAKVKALYKELDADDREDLKEDVAAVEEMDEPAPADEDTDDEEQEELEKGIKALVKGAVKSEVSPYMEDIKDEIKKFHEEQKAMAAQKAGVYHPQVQEKRKQLNSFIRAYAGAVLDGDETKVKELTTDATGSPYGGYVVDSELSAEIRHLVTEYGVARREMSTVQLSKNSYKANELATDVTVSWVDEGGAIPSTQIVIDQGTLELKKLAAITTLTRELLEDQEIDLFSFIGTRVAEGFAQAEDQAFFIGDGTSTYGSFTGILNASGVVNVDMDTGDTSFTNLTADYLFEMWENAPQIVRRTGKFYMRHDIMGIVRTLKDSQGNYIYQAPSQAGPATVWGRPVVEVEVMPGKTDDADSTPFVIYGDLTRSSIFGYKGGMRMDRFNAGVVRNVADNADVNLITSDREAVRWIERVGVLHIQPGAVVTLTTAAS